MSRDYKPATKPSPSGRSGSGFFTGLWVGILLGVAMTVGLIIYIKGEQSPFASFFKSPEQTQELPISNKITEEEIKPNSSNAVQDPNRFDFYTILPDTERKITEEQVKKNPTIRQENYYIQVGAFSKEDDANSLKTRLALIGFEALVQTADIPNKGTMHRVRIGPLNDLGKINKLTRDLETNGFKASLIKVNIESSNR